MHSENLKLQTLLLGCPIYL